MVVTRHHQSISTFVLCSCPLSAILPGAHDWQVEVVLPCMEATTKWMVYNLDCPSLHALLILMLLTTYQLILLLCMVVVA